MMVKITLNEILMTVVDYSNILNDNGPNNHSMAIVH